MQSLKPNRNSKSVIESQADLLDLWEEVSVYFKSPLQRDRLGKYHYSAENRSLAHRAIIFRLRLPCSAECNLQH